MKPMIGKHCLYARRRTALRDLADELRRSRDHSQRYLEHWERAAIMDGEHRTKVAVRDDWPNGRMTCICGLDTGWIALWDAEQRASSHQLQASRTACGTNGYPEK